MLSTLDTKNALHRSEMKSIKTNKLFRAKTWKNQELSLTTSQLIVHLKCWKIGEIPLRIEIRLWTFAWVLKLLKKLSMTLLTPGALVNQNWTSSGQIEYNLIKISMHL